MKPEEKPKQEVEKVEEKVKEKVEEKEEVVSAEEIKEAEPEANTRKRTRDEFDKEAWKPKTALGKQVKENKIKDIDDILDKGEKILESEIIDTLLPNIETDLLLVGQSKGKFGGGQRRVFKQTQKKTKEGNKPHFSTIAIIGNKNGYIGLGQGKSKETVPAREKSTRKAKLNLIKIKRGCGSWQCDCKEPHSIPFTVNGKCGSVKIKIMPAPKGTGLCIEKECAKILNMAGIQDVWSKTKGKTTTKTNLINACFDAVQQLVQTKVNKETAGNLGIVEGSVKKQEETSEEIKQDE